MEEKTEDLTLLEQGMSVIRVAVDMKVTRMAILTLIKAASVALHGTVFQWKEGLGCFSLRQQYLDGDLLSHASGACQSLMMTTLAPQ